MSNGRIGIRDLFKQAVKNDQEAVSALFSGFLSDGEEIKGCGYLGVLGYLLPEHSFWCVTNYRVSGMLVRRGGRVEFTSGFLPRVNSMALHQPSLVLLWFIVIFWLLAFVTLGFATPFALMDLGGPAISSMISVPVTTIVGLLLVRWVVRFYYRFRKSGVTFWMRERIPVYLFTDRQNLKAAQRLIASFTAIKKGERLVVESPAAEPLQPVASAAAA